MWDECDIRQEIERARKALKLPEEQLRPLGLMEWAGVEKRMYTEFTEQTGAPQHWLWPWEHTTPRKPLTALAFETDWPYESLTELVAADEICFALFEGNKKFWWYQGTVPAIVAVSAEIWLCEIGVLSKQYDWLLYINHHDVLYALGEPMVTRLAQLAAQTGRLDRLYQRPAIARPAR